MNSKGHGRKKSKSQKGEMITHLICYKYTLITHVKGFCSGFWLSIESQEFLLRALDSPLAYKDYISLVKCWLHVVGNIERG